MALHAIIPAGGAGTRLWPLSRAAHPKFLLPLTDPTRSLLTLTVARLAPLCESITIVTGADHAATVSQHARAALANEQHQPQLEIVIEPAGRNSMPAIGLAAARIHHRHGPHAMVGSFAADHTFTNSNLLRQAVTSAIEAAADGTHLVTLGIEPDHAATGYGYIQPAPAVNTAAGGQERRPATGCARKSTQAGAAQPGEAHATPAWQEVANFVEKPSAVRAEQFLQQGYYWNAGIFIATAGYLLGALADHQPALASALDALAQEWDELEPHARAARWEKLTPIAIDYALAEPQAQLGAVRVVALPRAAGWVDVGDFTALANYTNAYRQALLSVDTDATAWASAPTSTWEPKPVVVVGVENCIVVQTPDAILVTDQSRAQTVGKVAQKLRENGQVDLL